MPDIELIQAVQASYIEYKAENRESPVFYTLSYIFLSKLLKSLIILVKSI